MSSHLRYTNIGQRGSTTFDVPTNIRLRSANTRHNDFSQGPQLLGHLGLHLVVHSSHLQRAFDLVDAGAQGRCVRLCVDLCCFLELLARVLVSVFPVLLLTFWAAVTHLAATMMCGYEVDHLQDSGVHESQKASHAASTNEEAGGLN